jgi:nucleotide-binding universal stress UspA family protein
MLAAVQDQEDYDMLSRQAQLQGTQGPVSIRAVAYTPAARLADSELASSSAVSVPGAAPSSTLDVATTGTIVCGVNDSVAADAAVDVALELRSRLNLRLVLASIGDGILDADGTPVESLTTQHAREGARRLLQRIVQRRRLPASIECRHEVGDAATTLATLAQEEAADLLVIGARRSRLRRGRVRTDFADALQAASPCPVLIAPSS